MLYHLSGYLQQQISLFNVVHYISFRAITSLLQALVMMIVFGNFFINKYKSYFAAQAREDTPVTHQQKNNIPTMGGVLILLVLFITCFTWCNLAKLHVWLFLLGILLFGLIGFFDDWQKINKKKGIAAKKKWIFQLVFASMISVLMVWTETISPEISFPFFKHVHPNIGWLFIVWAIFIIVGCSNAVNLTDGLDGLASGVLLPNLATFAFLSYAASHWLMAFYLHIPFTGNAEITVIAGALIGSVLGFLWYNAYPAQIFMGDVGSLSLGTGLALVALMSKQEILLVLAGGVFVVETMSVILQVASFKCLHKRIFRMAPLHHHFELQGIHESKITMRFIIVSIILCMLALITIKLR